jgi:hypothetical protein
MVKTEMIWRSKIPELMRKVQTDIRKIHTGVFDESRGSIINGSLLTGAPGQPDDLRGDQWKENHEADNRTSLGVADPSAASVESGISRFNGKPITLHSPIGGSHSIKLTRMGEDNIVRKVVRDVVGG